MYSDEDGVATKQSQSVYDARIRTLVSTTSLLSWLCFGAALLNGEYSREKLQFSLPLKPLDLLSWSKFLWASGVLAHQFTGPDSILTSLSFHSTALAFIGTAIRLEPIPLGLEGRYYPFSLSLANSW
jgi:hypothetical protein